MPAAASPPLGRAALAVAAGGAVGAVARALVGAAIPHEPGAWPWATLLVNAAGAFLLGLLLTGLGRAQTPWPYARPLLGTGVLGGFTTFSALSLDAVLLAEAGRAPLAGAYVLASLVVTVGGVLLARRVLRA